MKFGRKVKSAMTGLALLVNGCGTNLCPLLENGEECGQNDPRHAWIREYPRITNYIDLRLAEDGKIEYRGPSASDRLYCSHFNCEGNYFFIITNDQGEIEFEDEISLGPEYQRFDWPARGGQLNLFLLDENRNISEFGNENKYIDVRYLGLRY